MASQYKVVDLAEDIFLNLSSPSNLSVSFVAYWIRANVGKINNLILTDFVIDDTTLEFTSPSNIPLSYDVGAIFVKSFEIYNLDKLIRDNIGVVFGGQAMSVESDGGKVNLVNPHVVSRLFLDMKKELIKELQILTNGFKINRSNPSSISGEDSISLGDLGYSYSFRYFNTTPGFYERQHL